MKTDRKIKAEKRPPKLKAVKENGKATPQTNGKHLLAAYEHIPVGIVESSLDGKYMDVNEEFCRILGYSRKELLRRGIKDCTHEDDYAIDYRLYEQLIAGKIPFYKIEKRFVRKDGEVIWVELTRSLVSDETGEPLYTVGVVLDISDRKDVEKVLRDSVERLRLATGAAQMFMWEWDFQTQSYTIADNFEQVLGFSAGLLPKNKFETVWALSPEDDVQRISEEFARVIGNQSDLRSLPYRVINPENGRVVWLEISAKIVYDRQGNPERMFGVAQNITESKNTQDQIAIISRVPEENPNPVMRITTDGNVLYANPVSTSLLEDWIQGTKPTVPDEVQNAIIQAFRSGVKTEVEIKHREKNFSFTLAPIAEGGYVNLYGKDITERKEAEFALRRSEANLRNFLENASVGIHWVDKNGIIIWANQAELDMLGYKREDYLGRHIAEFHVDEPVIEDILKRLACGETLDGYEARLRHKDGSIRYGIINSNVLWEDGEFIHTRCFTRDITERKQMEVAIRKSEERFRALVSQTTAGITESDMDGRLTFVNPRFIEILGYPEEELIGRTIWELTYPDDIEENRRFFERMITHGESYQLEKRLIRRDGSLLWTNVSVSTIRDLAGNSKGGVGVVLDIEERKRAEAGLIEFARKQEALYNLSDQLHRTTSLPDVYNAALDAILSALQCDRASILLFDDTDVMRFVAWRGLSDAYREATDGHSPWKPDAKDPPPISMDDVRTADLDEALRSVILGEGIGSLAFIPLVANGTLIGKFMIYFNVPHPFDDAELDFSLTIAHQLASGIDRKRAEEALRESERKFTLIYENLPFAAALARPQNGVFVDVNQEFEKVFGYSKQEIIGKTSLELGINPKAESLQQMLEELQKHGSARNFEVELFTRSGEMRSFINNIDIVSINEEKYILSTLQEITERKQTEKRLALLAEISELLRNVEDPHELMYSISEAIGEHLHVKRVLFNEIDLEHDREIVHRDYHNSVDSAAGVHKISAYSSITSQEVAAGKTVVNIDSKTDPRTTQDYEKTYALSGERSYVVVPMMRDNRWVASLWVSDDAPRGWSPDDVSLLETIAERTWTVIEKLRINTALRESERRFREMIDALPAAIYTTDAKGTLTHFNPAAVEFSGRTPELGTDKWCVTWKLYYPDGSPMPHEECPMAITLKEGRIIRGVEAIAERPDGKRIWFEPYPTPLRDSEGRVVGGINMLVDITERKRAEEALRASEELYRAIARNIPGGGVYVVDKDFRYLIAEGPVTDAFGLTREMLEGHTVTEVFPGERGERMEVRLRKNFAGESVSFETNHNGRVYWTQQAPVLDSIGQAIILTLDITERKQAEESLRTSELRYRNLFDLVPVAVYSCDADGLIQEYNHRAVELWGREPSQNNTNEKYCGSYKIFYPDGRYMPHVECPMARVLRGETPQPHEFEILVEREDGRRRNVIAHPLLLRNEQGEITGAINCLYDITEHKRAEEALRQSDERFARFMQHLPGLAWIKDLDGRYVYANAAAEKAFNTPWEKLYGQMDEDIFPPAVAAQFRRNDAQALTDEKGVQVIETLEHADGVLHSSLVSKFPIPGPDGSTTLIGGTAFDITERLQADEALRESEERFRAILRQATAGIVRKDAKGKLLFVNEAFCNMLGYTESDLIGKTVWEFMHPDDVAESKQSYERLMGEGIPFKLERRFLREDGSVISVDASVSPIMDATGKPQSAVAVEVDITGRKLAEEALHESEERFRAILRQATAGIVRKDAGGRFIFVNQAYCNMVGYTESELLNKTCWDVMHEDEVPENKRLYDRMMREGIPFKFEKRLIRKSGSIVWVDVSVSPIMDAAGKPQSAVAVEVDISGRKQAEDALRELNMQLEDRVLIRTAKLRAVNQTLREEIAERQRMEEALRQSEALARSNEEKLSTLFELLPVGISFLDPEGQIIQMNPALANITKLSKEQLVNEVVNRSRNYIRANGTLMPPTEFASRRALTEGKTVYNVETGVVLEDGEVLWTSVSAAPVNVADVGAVVVTVDITESKRAERALQESRERLQILSQRLVEVQEEERRAIARELHDRVGQTLAALNINLIIISGQLGGKVDEQTSSRLNDSMKLVAETIALVRDVMSNLRPSVLDDYGLEAAIDSHLSQFTSRYEISVRFEKPSQPISRLGSSIEMTFLRIAQEALMNIARHAQATQVHLALWQENNTVCLTVQDNGTGITSWQDANRPGSHGLTIMRERAEAFGGNLKVNSVPGKGTKVEVKIPVETNNPSQVQEGKSQ